MLKYKSAKRSDRCSITYHLNMAESTRCILRILFWLTGMIRTRRPFGTVERSHRFQWNWVTLPFAGIISVIASPESLPCRAHC